MGIVQLVLLKGNEVESDIVMKIRPIFKWFDFWVGLFYDTKKKRLYIFPIPMCGIYIERSSRK